MRAGICLYPLFVAVLLCATLPASAIGYSDRSLQTEQVLCEACPQLPERPSVSTPGAVEIARFGTPEDVLAFRNLGFLAVRFDPAFEPPYQITRISFPSLTKDGSPAVFPSIRLCGATATGAPDLGNPLFVVAAYSGQSNGWNEIPVSISIPDSGRTLFVCIEMPTTASAGFPNGFPFLRMDYRDLDRGFFADTYEILPTGQVRPIRDRNLAIALGFQIDPVSVPVQATSNLGANRVSEGVEFRFLKPPDTAADGSAMKPHVLWRTEVLWRRDLGPWNTLTSIGSGQSSVTIPFDFESRVWSTQAIDRNGHRAVLSNAAFALNSLQFDTDEPNGTQREATPIELSRFYRDEACFPAGDKDFFSFQARPGSDLHAQAAMIGRDGISDLELVLLLYDDRGMLVATSDSTSSGGANLRYAVPARGASDKLREFALEVADVRGSELSPLTCPRTDLLGANYVLAVYAEEHLKAAAWVTGSCREHQRLRTLGQSLGRDSRVVFALPDVSGTGNPRLQVFDVKGRLLRSITVTGPDNDGVVTWDCADESGKRVSSGVYFVRLWPLEHRIRVVIRR
jgi:hypothetical protein